MTTSWKAQMARKLVEQEEPEEIVALVDAVFPAIIDVLSSDQLRDFVRHLFDEHLTALLAAMDSEDRAALLRELLPVMAREFHLQDMPDEDLAP